MYVHGCSRSLRRLLTTRRTDVNPGDPVDGAVNWAREAGVEVPFICSANDGRPGGDWETGAAGYEERLCRRSTLSANLASPAPAPMADPHYPIPIHGGILSPQVGMSPHVVLASGLC